MNNNEIAIKTLKHMLNLVENGEIYITGIEEQGHFNDVCYLGGRQSPTDWTTTLDWYSILKKTYKSQQEIYQELYEFKLHDATEYSVLTDDECKMDANRYAVKNTAKVWREQYE